MNRIARALIGFTKYVLTYRGDKVKYLRSLGMEVGDGCEIISSIPSFGSEPYLIRIKNRCTIAGGCMFITHDASSRLYRAQLVGNQKFGNLYGPIRIEDDVFVGAGSIILPNVTIGPFSIVAAGSVVTRNVPPRTVVAGNPAKKIADIEETIRKHDSKMVEHSAQTREELRSQLTAKFFGDKSCIERK